MPVNVPALPLSASGRHHTSAILFAAIFCFLIVDCFIASPQLLVLAAAAAAAAAAIFIGSPMRPQR
jgi:hypothetical protein